MSVFAALTDPTDLDAVRSTLATADPDGRLSPLDLRVLRIADDAADAVADEVAAQLAIDDHDRPGAGRPARVALLVDATLIHRAGEDLKARTRERLARRFDVTPVVLRHGDADAAADGADEPGATLHADDAAIEAAVHGVADADAVVSVGGGTITDIAKVATARRGGTPLVVVQTAASVDGFTDSVSVVLRDGVKRTVPSRWPDVVLADTTTIATAPPDLTAAGYGEVLSMFTAPADWYLASVLGMDDSFHPAPAAMLTAFGADIAEWSPGVGSGDPEAITRLTRLLALRGIATGVAGTTACLSGVEHLVSHVLDMHHGARHVPIGRHGAQVGVASLVAAAAWEHLHARLDAGRVDVAALALDPDRARARITAAFGPLDADGRLAGECWRDYERKLVRWNASRDAVAAGLADWHRHRAVLDDLVLPSEALGASLVASGAPARFEQLDPVIDPALARWAVANCSLMRDRFTVLDLLDALGWWQDADVAAVLDRAARVAQAVPAGSTVTTAVGTTTGSTVGATVGAAR